MSVCGSSAMSASRVGLSLLAFWAPLALVAADDSNYQSYAIGYRAMGMGPGQRACPFAGVSGWPHYIILAGYSEPSHFNEMNSPEQAFQRPRISQFQRFRLPEFPQEKNLPWHQCCSSVASSRSRGAEAPRAMA